MRPCKFLIVATVYQHLRAFHLPVVRWLRSLGHEVHGAAADISQCRDCIEAFSSVHDVPFSRSLSNISAALRSMIRLRSILHAQRYDAIHVHTPIAAFLTRLVAASLPGHGPVLMYTAHGFHFLRGGSARTNFLYSQAERIGGLWTDVLVVINDEDRRAALRLAIVPRYRIVQIPGVGIDLQRFQRNSNSLKCPKRPGALRDELKLGPNDKIVLMLAELSPVKRHIDAITAVAGAEMQSFHLVLSGSGVMEQYLKSQVSSLGLDRRVHFLGFRKDVRCLLEAADVCLLVSEREGLPLSIMEAMAMEVPVVGTNVRGIRDLVGNGAGIVCPPYCPTAIGDALRRAVSGGCEINAMVALASERVKNYSLERVLDAHASLYETFVPGFRSHVT